MNAHSHHYKVRLKNLTELVLGLHPLVAKVPAALPVLGSESAKFAKKMTAKEVTQRKEAHTKLDENRLDRLAISYWLVPLDEPESRVRKSA